MKPINQLLRQPIRTIAVLILLTVSASFICLGWGVLQSAKATTEELDESFVTLAIVNSAEKTSTDYYIDEETHEFVTFSVFSSNGKRVDELADVIRSSTAVRKEYNQQFISAYNPAFKTLTSATSSNRYNQDNDIPYTKAVAVVKVTEIVDVSKEERTEYFDEELNMTVISGGHSYVVVYGETVEYLALHPDYEPREKAYVYLNFNSPEELETANVEVGKTYIVYSDWYADNDLHMRTQEVASGFYATHSASEIDFDKYLSYDLSEYPLEVIMNGETWPNPDGTTTTYPIVAQYTDEENEMYFLFTQHRLDMIGRFSMTSTMVRCAEVTGTVEEFLADPENEIWLDYIKMSEMQYNCVPVFGTDMLESFYLFHENIAYVSEGRSLESADYAEGKKVCLISENLAYSSGLKVGDKIDFSFYSGHPAWNGYFSKANASDYYQFTEFDGTVEYEIVGLYRHTAQWQTGAWGSGTPFNFSPNTVFVPSASLEGYETYTEDSNLFYSVAVKNGHIDEMKQTLAENDWTEDFLVFYDGGYSSIESTVNSLNESAKELFMAAAATWLAVLAAYIALFVIRQRRNAGLMLSLGAGRTRTARFVLVTAMIPAVVSAVIGAAVGGLLLSRTVNSVLNDAAEATGLAFSSTASMSAAELQSRVQIPMSSMVIACGALIAVYLAVLAIVARAISRKKPLTLIRK